MRLKFNEIQKLIFSIRTNIEVTFDAKEFNFFLYKIADDAPILYSKKKNFILNYQYCHSKIQPTYKDKISLDQDTPISIYLHKNFSEYYSKKDAPPQYQTLILRVVGV